MTATPRQDRLPLVLPIVLVVAVVGQNVFSAFILRDLKALTNQVQALTGRLTASAPGEAPSLLAPGLQAPDFQYPNSANQPTSLSQFRGRSVLLVFSSPTCPYCHQLYPELLRFSRDPSASDVEVVILQVNSGPEDNRRLRSEQGFDFEVLAAESQSFVDYRVPGTPFLVRVDAEGRVADSGTANSYEQIARIAGS